MEMPEVLLKFNNNKEEKIALPRVPVAGDWIDVRGKEYQVSKVTLANEVSAVVTIDTDLITDKPVQIPSPRFG
jgi:hypothetical protein